MSRLIRRIFDRANQKFSPRTRSARLARTAAGVKTRLMLQPLEERTVPTVYTVTNTNDTGTGSLRAAITAADADLATPHTIDLTGVSGTISLATALPSITKDMTIQGPGASTLTVARGATSGFQLFTLNGSGLNVTIENMTLTNGSASNGGAIGVVDQNLTLSGMTLAGNTATNGGAIYVSANATIAVNNSTITNNTASTGGGFDVVGTVGNATITINNSTLSNNTGQGGVLNMTGHGGVSISNSTLSNNRGSFGGVVTLFTGNASLSIDHSTISGNSAGQAGAIYFSGSGVFTISSSTIANNTATTGGALYVANFGNAITLTSVTMTGNTATTGGAIHFPTGGGGIDIINSIISGNGAATGPNINAGATLTVTSYYDAIDNTAGFPTSFTPGFGDLSAANSTPTALKLGALTTKTGPGGTFQLIPLLAGSTAIDAGDSNQAGTTDELGNNRPQGAGVDMGTYERFPGPDVAASGPAAPNFPNVTTAGGTTYQFSVVYADTVNINTATIDANDVSVVVPSGVSPVTVSLVGYDATNPQAVVATYQFTAPGGAWGIPDDGVYTINMNASQVSDANGSAVAGPIGTFRVAVPHVLTVTATTDTGAGSGTSGDLRYCITQANLDANTPVPDLIDMTGVSGTISLGSALPTLTNTTIINGPGSANLTVTRGTGSFRIINFAPTQTTATLTMSGFKITNGNGAAVAGGGIALAGGSGLSLSNMTLQGNSVGSPGGAIYNGSSGGITIDNSIIQNNTAVGGAAIYNNGGGPVTITNSQLLNNRSTSSGGAIYNTGGLLTLSGDTIQGNSNSSTGTVFSNTGAPTQITNTLIQNNTAAGGAGIYNASSGSLTVTNSQVLNNISTSTGGGIYNGSSGNVTLTGDTITGNSTSSSGGGVLAGTGLFNMTDTTVANNTSTGSGGGVFVPNSPAGIVISRSSITGNWAKNLTGGGGGVYVSGILGAGGATVSNTTIANNLAVNGAGIATATLNGNLNLTSDTITGNTATNANTIIGSGGGGIALRGATTSAGIVANINLDNTIVAGNLAVNGYNDITAVPAATPLSTTAVTAKYSDIGSTAGFHLTDNGNNLIAVNPLLGALGTNGGTTQSVSLLAASPAIGTGDPALNGTTDQRGVARPQGTGPGAQPDMGAYERTTNTLSAAATVSNVTAAGAPATYQFTVMYADDVAINAGSIAATNVTVAAPTGVTAPTVSLAAVNSSNPNKVIATYQFTAPGGAWSLADAGIYTVNMVANQVSDANGSVPAGPLASFVAAPPQTFTVTATTDTGVGSAGAGDLRYCITQANAVASANLSSPVPSIIVFSNSTAGGAVNFYDGTQHTITLAATSALPTVLDNLTITGPGSTLLTVNRAGGAFQILPINNTSGPIAVSLSGMTLSGAVNSSNGGAISDTNTAALNLTDLTIQNNSTSGLGGGLYLATGGTAVTLTNCTLQNNTSGSTSGGGAICFSNSGALTMTGSTIQANRSAGSGAAVYVSAGGNSYINITQSTIANNSAALNGGGLRVGGGVAGLLIDRSTLSGNTANTGQGGGVYFAGTIGGGGFKIVNTTIANNKVAGTTSSGGGIAFSGSMLGLANIVSSTITGNSAAATTTTTGTGGGGITLISASTAVGGFSTIALDNSIISGNSAPGNGSTDISATSAPSTNVTVSDSYCAIGNTTGYIPSPLGGSLPVGAALNMGVLSGNGGPTQTVPLLVGSPAIDAGDPAQGGPGFTDQRGTARPQGAGVDIGAFEQIPGIPTAGGPAGGFTSLTDANAAANTPYTFTVTYADSVAMNYSTINNNSNAVTVTTPAGVSPVTVSFVSATPATNAASITATYQFTAPGGSWDPADNGTYTVNMAANQVQNTNNVYVQPGLLGTFKVAMAYTGANALVVTGTGDAGTGSGLAGDLRYVLTKAAAAVGTSTPNQITFSNSTAGGATNFYDGTQHTIALSSSLPAIPEDLTITGPGSSVLTVNRSGATGFQFFSLTGPTAETVTVSGMTISGASASTGGVFAMIDQTLALTNMTLTGNTAGSGAVVAASGPATINVSNSTVTTNTAGSGSGFYLSGSGGATLTIADSTVSNNTGSAIYSNSQASVSVSRSTLANNRASIGGAIQLNNFTPHLTITDCTISGNSAGSAGAIYFRGGTSGTFTLSDSTIVKNTASTSNGGAIYLASMGTSAMLTSDTLMGNTAGTNGGAIYYSSGVGGITIDNSILVANTATNGQNINAGASVPVGVDYSAVDNQSGFTFTDLGGNLSTADSTPAALHLQPLASETGPNGTFQMVTFTAGSTAIDAGDMSLAGGTDQLGTVRPQGVGVDIGAYEWIPGPPAATPPAAGFTPVNDANAASSNPYQFSVVYQDYTAMNYSSINGNSSAITVTTPAGVASVTVSFVSATPTSNAASITATYQFTMPGGWVTADNGIYTVNMVANQVKDTSNLYVPAGPIGTFQVGLSYSGANALVVTNTGDTGAGSGFRGDLRYCLTMSALASGNSTPNQIVFSNTTAGGATNFYDGNQHTIILGSALPAIPDNLAMTGPGANALTVTRAAGPAFEIFNVNGPTAQTVTLGGMRVTGGSATTGGAIGMVDQTLTLNGMTLTGNTATNGAAVYVGGAGTVNVNNSSVSSNSASSGAGFYLPAAAAGATLNIDNSTLNANTGNGAVVYAPSQVSININNSTLSNNRGNTGGVIDAFGANPNLSITNSTLSGNSANNAGVMYINSSGSMTISNSTFAHNTAANSAGVIEAVNIGFVLTLTSVTMVGNSAFGSGGAIYYPTGAGGITIDNSILAGNSAANGPDISAGAALTVGVSYSAIDNLAGFTLTDNGNNLSTANSTPTALHLGPLQLNNGGTTQTYGLQFGSTAVDVGDPTLGGGGQTDQNGTLRPQGAGVDIGSVERIPGIPAATPPAGGWTTVTDANAAANNPYQFTVVYTDDTAVNHLTIDSSDVSVVTPAGVAPVTVTLVPGSITPNADAQTVTATYQFTVSGGWVTADDGTYTVMMNGNQVLNTTGHAVPAGSIGTFTVALAYTGANALVVTNTGDAGAGSGLAGDLRYVLTKAAGVVGSSQPNQIVFSNTTAGGATNFYDGTQHTIALSSSLPAVPENVIITGPGSNLLTVNRAGAFGFQFFSISGPTAQTVAISGMTISGASATTGAAINMVDQTLNLNDVTLTGNAASSGAAVYVGGAATIIVNNCNVTANSASSGAGFYMPTTASGATLTIANSTLSNNTASGAVLYSQTHVSVNISNSTLSNNRGSLGGVMDLFAGDPNLSIANSTISGNSANTAGALYIFSGGTVVISNTTLANNTASSGGAIYAYSTGAGMTFKNLTLVGNSASTGGAIYYASGSGGITIDNSILAGNTANSAPNIYTGSSQSVTVAYSAIDNVSGFTLINGGNNLSVANSTTVALALQPLANATGPNGTFAVIGLGAGSTAIDAGDPAQGGTGQTDEIGTPRPQGPGVDIGAVEKIVVAPPPQVSSIVVGDGTAERSEVRQIVVTFDSAVTFTGGNGNAAAAFQLLHTTYGSTVFNTLVNNLQTAVTTNGSGQTVVTITFTTTGNSANEVDPLSVQSTAGGPTTASLGDGKFQLTVLASNVSGPGGQLAGNGTTAGTNFVTPSETAGTTTGLHLWRLFGDINGDGLDDLTDLTAFRNTYNAALGNPVYVNALDADNDGVIDLDDLTAFRNHYNHTV
jgi:hypothetical protein